MLFVGGPAHGQDREITEPLIPVVEVLVKRPQLASFNRVSVLAPCTELEEIRALTGSTHHHDPQLDHSKMIETAKYHLRKIGFRPGSPFAFVYVYEGYEGDEWLDVAVELLRTSQSAVYAAMVKSRRSRP